MSLLEKGPEEFVMSDRGSFEACSQLVSCIRYQLSDPHAYLNKYRFPTKAYFAFSEGNREYYRNKEGSSWRHSISFAWVIQSHYFSKATEMEEPEVFSPVMTIEGCLRKWYLTIAPFMNTTPVQQEVYLTCSYCKDVSVSARVEMDLYLGSEKIGNDAVTNVKFDKMVKRHLVYTGPVLHQEDANDDLLKAYTIQGIFNLSNCCDELQELQCYLPQL